MTTTELVIPLAEESVVVDTVSSHRRVTVQVSTHSDRREVATDLNRIDVVVEHVAVGRPVSATPPMREENGVTIIPVMEEVLVVTKQLFLREELHIRRVERTETVREMVTLRRQDATVTRLPISDPLT